MNWLYIVIAAYALNAIAITIDKFLLTKSIPQPAAYTFNVAMLNGIVTLLLLPLGFELLSPFNAFIGLFAGVAFTLALYFMYNSLKLDEASRVIPYIGSLNPFFIFFLAILFLNEKLAGKEIIAFLLILSGSILISWRFRDKKNIFQHLIPKRISAALHEDKKREAIKVFGIATVSALLFAISYTLTKHIYNSTSFLNGFVWTRFGVLFGILLILIPKENRATIVLGKNKPGKKTGGIFLFGQACGGLSFFLINYSFSLNSVTLVHALQGIQYIILFLIIIFLSKKFPRILEEKLTPILLTQKISAIFLIVFGLYFLVV